MVKVREQAVILEFIVVIDSVRQEMLEQQIECPEGLTQLAMAENLCRNDSEISVSEYRAALLSICFRLMQAKLAYEQQGYGDLAKMISVGIDSARDKARSSRSVH